MLMPKQTRKTILSTLFKEGVMVARKDFNSPKHPELDVPNLYVIKAMQSLKSRGYVKEQFAWRHFYWYLTDEGIQHLREYLHLPEEVVPDTMKKSAKPEAPRRPMGGRGGDRGGYGDRDRDSYRRGPPGGGYGEKKLGGAPGGFEPSFRAGFGRGGPPGAGRGSSY